MRFSSLWIALFCCGCVSNNLVPHPNQEVPDSTQIERPEDVQAAQMLDDFLSKMDDTLFLTGELSRLRARDSHARRAFVGAFRDPDIDPSVRAAFQEFGGEYIAQIDEINTRELQRLMSGMDWRTLASMGAHLFDAAFLIVQHTNDFAYQESVLEELKPLAEENLIDGGKFALMYDRVELRVSGTQLYGTQADCVNGQYDVVDLLDPANVDARRTELGMEPVADYLEQLRELYGSCGDGSGN